jgi:hypothetical protein
MLSAGVDNYGHLEDADAGPYLYTDLCDVHPKM